MKHSTYVFLFSKNDNNNNSNENELFDAKKVIKLPF